MPDIETNSITDEILKNANDYIKELLKNKRLKPEMRAQLEIQGYFLMFLTVDHEKMQEMYPYFKEQKAKQERWEKWWDKLQWVVIPMTLTALFGLISNAVSVLYTIYTKVMP